MFFSADLAGWVEKRMLLDFTLKLLGLVLIFGVGWTISTNRRAIRFRVVGAAFLLQILVGVVAIRTSIGRNVIHAIADGYQGLISASQSGVSLLLGSVGTMPGIGLAFTLLPVIIFFGAMAAVLNYLRVIPLLVTVIGGLLHRLIGVGRVESLCAAANIIVGQSESPLVIRPYLEQLSPSSLFAVMTSGMAGVAGTILAAYAQIGMNLDYLLDASFMAAPAGLLMAKLIYPDTVDGEVAGKARLHHSPDSNIIMAVSQGAQDGIRVAVNVGAMLLSVVGLIAVLNALLAILGGILGDPTLSLQHILAYVFAPFMPLIGIPLREAMSAGGLLGERIVLNEFIAFIHLHSLEPSLSRHTVAVLTFALCGFANIGSIGIQIAVIGGLVAKHRVFVSQYGVRSLVGATLANMTSAIIAGSLLN